MFPAIRFASASWVDLQGQLKLGDVAPTPKIFDDLKWETGEHGLYISVPWGMAVPKGEKSQRLDTRIKEALLAEGVSKKRWNEMRMAQKMVLYGKTCPEAYGRLFSILAFVYTMVGIGVSECLVDGLHITPHGVCRFPGCHATVLLKSAICNRQMDSQSECVESFQKTRGQFVPTWPGGTV